MTDEKDKGENVVELKDKTGQPLTSSEHGRHYWEVETLDDRGRLRCICVYADTIEVTGGAVIFSVEKDSKVHLILPIDRLISVYADDIPDEKAVRVVHIDKVKGCNCCEDTNKEE